MDKLSEPYFQARKSAPTLCYKLPSSGISPVSHPFPSQPYSYSISPLFLFCQFCPISLNSHVPIFPTSSCLSSTVWMFPSPSYIFTIKSLTKAKVFVVFVVQNLRENSKRFSSARKAQGFCLYLVISNEQEPLSQDGIIRLSDKGEQEGLRRSGPHFLKRQGQGHGKKNKLDLIRILAILQRRISKKQSSKLSIWLKISNALI